MTMNVRKEIMDTVVTFVSTLMVATAVSVQMLRRDSCQMGELVSVSLFNGDRLLPNGNICIGESILWG